MYKLGLYPDISKEEIEKYTYYVFKRDWVFELRQTRFIDINDHPWDVCAVSNSLEQLKDMYGSLNFTSPVIWPE
ncbi:MAG TPA: hypothetical protein DDY71_05220 [Spirochaetia bacterium]|nr:hypothetical protein [Spirochaetia bacterium]